MRRYLLLVAFFLFLPIISIAPAQARISDEFEAPSAYCETPAKSWTCKTSGDVSSSPCGGQYMSCYEACEEAYDPSSCWNFIKNDLRSWSTYVIKENKISGSYGSSKWCSLSYQYEYSAARTCSTGDKMCGTATSCSPSPYLWSGTCTCDIGNKYKVCCLTEADGKRRTINAELSGSDNDNILPEEGDCPMYMGNVETITDNPSAPLTCPQPPEINITVNGVSGTEFNIKNGDEVTVAWRITGYDRVTDTNITGVTG